MKRIIQLKNVEKYINKKLIFNIDCLEVYPGDIIIINGPSGSGKTTLLNILGMNDDITKGQYYFENHDVTSLGKKRKTLIKRESLSFIFQDFGLIEEETIDFNLEIGLKYLKISKTEKKELKNSALRSVNLDKTLNTPVQTLSGGEKQRVALARIIMKPSKIILADEPTGSLDSDNRDIVTSILKKMAENGKAIVIVTHDNSLTGMGNKQVIL